MMRMNRVIFSLKYISMAFMICFSAWMLMRFSIPFSLDSNTNVVYRILFASISVIILPGYLIFNIMQLKKRFDMDLFESLTVSFGISLVIIEILSIIAIEAHLSSLKIALAVLIISFILFMFNFIKENKIKLNYINLMKSYSDKISLIIFVFLIFFILVTAVLLYKIESPVSSGEDQLHISLIRKILENSTVTKANILYKQEVVYTYLYPGLHMAIALISRFSALDPIIVYAKFRFVLGVLSLLIIWSFSKVLFKHRYIAFVITCTSLALIYNGMAGRLPGFHCAQLIPISHISDIGMSILLPLALLFSFKYILTEGFLNRFFILFSLLIGATIIIHTREGAQILFYYVIAFFAYLIFNRKDKNKIHKILMIIFFMVLFGMAYRYVHSMNVGHINVLEDSSRKKAVGVFIDLSRDLKTAFSTPENHPDTLEFVQAGRLIFKKHISFAIPMALLILLLFRKTFWGLFFSSTIMGSVLFMKFSILAILLVILTYSEMMYTPARFILYFAYIIFGFLIYVALAGFDKMFSYIKEKLPPRMIIAWFMAIPIFVYLFSYFVLLNITNFTQDLIYKYGTYLIILMLFVIIPVIFLNLFASKISNFQNYVMNGRFKYKLLGFVNLFFILCPMYQYGGHENTNIFDNARYQCYRPANIFEEYKARASIADISNFKDYYKDTNVFIVPFDLVEFIRKNIPPGNIFIYDISGEGAVFIPVFANQYIVAAPAKPHFLDMKVIDDEYLGSGAQQAIFNNIERDKEKINFIYRFNATYLLLEPSFYHLSNIFDKYNNCFKRVYDKEGYLIYKINRGAIGVLLESYVKR